MNREEDSAMRSRTHDSSSPRRCSACGSLAHTSCAPRARPAAPRTPSASATQRFLCALLPTSVILLVNLKEHVGLLVAAVFAWALLVWIAVYLTTPRALDSISGFVAEALRLDAEPGRWVPTPRVDRARLRRAGVRARSDSRLRCPLCFDPLAGVAWRCSECNAEAHGACVAELGPCHEQRAPPSVAPGAGSWRALAEAVGAPNREVHPPATPLDLQAEPEPTLAPAPRSPSTPAPPASADGWLRLQQALDGGVLY